MAVVFELVAERLRLRPFEPGDLPAFVAYRSSPEVARYQSWDSSYSMADAERFLAEQRHARPRPSGPPPACEALGAVMTRLFEGHGLHRIYAETDDRNLAVHRLLERLGFRCEARLVEADWFKGEWSTLRVYAVLRRDWETRTVQRAP
jgi:RimJ/RimL family protein N-acetyltransferase